MATSLGSEHGAYYYTTSRPQNVRACYVRVIFPIGRGRQSAFANVQNVRACPPPRRDLFINECVRGKYFRCTLYECKSQKRDDVKSPSSPSRGRFVARVRRRQRLTSLLIMRYLHPREPQSAACRSSVCVYASD